MTLNARWASFNEKKSNLGRSGAIISVLRQISRPSLTPKYDLSVFILGINNIGWSGDDS